MYSNTLHLQIAGAERSTTEAVEIYGISVYVDTDPEFCGYDFMIEPEDKEGILIFREFAAKMAAHYQSLKTVP
jgi:hypothetical protein